MKVARLEMKLVMALFLTRYEFNRVDKGGKFPDPLPVRNKNDVHQVRAGCWMMASWRCSSCLLPST